MENKPKKRGMSVDMLDVMVVVGLLLVTAGLAYWSPPAAAVVLGSALFGLGVTGILRRT